MTAANKIEIAVIGGGIGGLCVAIGLLKYKHLNVNIYEAASKFSEIGAGVGLGPNSQRAMAAIDPKIYEAFIAQATNNGWESHRHTWFQFRDGTEGHGEELLTAPKNQTGQTTLHRALFLDELVKLVPKEIAHFGKRVVQIVDNGENGVTLHFKDNTTVIADAVIGADGIHSPTRAFLLGADHPATKPQFTHTVAYRGLIPMDEAREAIGSEFAENAIMWIGKGKSVMTYPISFGKIVNIVAIEAPVESWDHAELVIPVERGALEKLFSGLSKTPASVISLLEKTNVNAWSMWDMLENAPYYNKGNVCMMGDGAHATTPYQGQGAGQATEDALVLESLLGRVTDVKQIAAAFKAYDQVRRPRTQKVVATSREAGEILTQIHPSFGEDLKKIKQEVETRMSWMWDADMNEHVQDAVKAMEVFLA